MASDLKWSMTIDKMNIFYETVTGSIYEIDVDSKQIRRVYGKTPTTERVGKEGQWKGIDSIQEVVLDEDGKTSLLIVWGLNEDGSLKTTLTSPIVKKWVANEVN